MNFDEVVSPVVKITLRFFLGVVMLKNLELGCENGLPPQ
jgi:hypothetical protein